jgi:hypothetical protein
MSEHGLDPTAGGSNNGITGGIAAQQLHGQGCHNECTEKTGSHSQGAASRDFCCRLPCHGPDCD